MFKLVLEKAEEPEIKLPTSTGLSKKQESSRKTSISALLTMLKLLTVRITINWKILKEMGILDHLTCFLRNLHAGQEATVRTEHGTTDWFQIGKRNWDRRDGGNCYMERMWAVMTKVSSFGGGRLWKISFDCLCFSTEWDFWLGVYIPDLEKEMATHSSVLAWRIPGTGEPGGLLSLGSHRVGHNWNNLAAAAAAACTWPEDTKVNETCLLPFRERFTI